MRPERIPTPVRWRRECAGAVKEDCDAPLANRALPDVRLRRLPRPRPAGGGPEPTAARSPAPSPTAPAASCQAPPSRPCTSPPTSNARSRPRPTGAYTIPQLPVGAYVVIITANGFQTTTLDNIEVTAGSTVRVDGTLAVGGLQDAVTVSAEARQIQTDSVKVTTAISSKFIQDLPLVVGGQLRSPLDLSLIAPEAKTGTSGDGGRGNIVIGGGQEGGWDLTVDGVSATPGAPFEQRLWTTLNSPSVEAITEFAVDTNGFKAEFGHAGGGAVSFVSRSGTQPMARQGLRVHARRRVRQRTTTSARRSAGRSRTLSQHDFGGVFGGPVMHPEALQRPRQDVLLRLLRGLPQQDVGRAADVVTIPTAEMYNGDFSNWRDASGNLIPIYDPATTRRQSERAGLHPRSVPEQPDPGRALQQHQPRGDPAGDDAAGSAGRAEQLHLHAGRSDQHEPVEQVQRQDRSQPVEQGSPRLPVPLGRGAGRAAERRPERRPAGAAQQLPRRGFAHLRLSLQLGSRDLAEPAQSRHVRPQQLVSSCAPRSTAIRAGARSIGLRNVPGPDLLFPLLDFSDDYLDWGRSEWGGSGNYLWASPTTSRGSKSRHTWKFGFIVQQDHYDGYGWHTAAGTYNFNRGATAGFLANGNLDTTRRDGQRLRELPARRSAVVRDHDQPLRLGSVALLLRLRAGRLAHQRQADAQLRRPLRVHAADLGRPLPRRLLELQPEPAESGGGRHPRRVGVRRRGPWPHRQDDDVRGVAVGLQPAARRRLQPERRTRSCA